MATSASVHADRRYRYMRGLWSKASSASVANYREKEFQHLCKALARISRLFSDSAFGRRIVEIGPEPG